VNKSWQAEEMVSVPVTYKYSGYVDSGAATHHLALRPFATVKEDGVAVSLYQYRRKTSSDRWH
jgi:hypothetical protein